MSADGSVPYGIGIDIVEERQLVELANDDRALGRTFSQRELEECSRRAEDRAPALARRFAAKEALMKACRHVEGHPARIEILHDETGAPHARWSFLDEHALEARISVASTASLAVAVAVVFDSGRKAG